MHKQHNNKENKTRQTRPWVRRRRSRVRSNQTHPVHGVLSVHSISIIRSASVPVALTLSLHRPLSLYFSALPVFLLRQVWRGFPGSRLLQYFRCASYQDVLASLAYTTHGWRIDRRSLAIVYLLSFLFYPCHSSDFP